MMNVLRKMFGKPVVFRAMIFLKGGQTIQVNVTELSTQRNADNSLASISWKLADDRAKFLYLRLEDISAVHTMEY